MDRFVKKRDEHIAIIDLIIGVNGVYVMPSEEEGIYIEQTVENEAFYENSIIKP